MNMESPGAASRISSAADDMRNAAGSFDGSVRDMQIILDDFNIRFAQAVEQVVEAVNRMAVIVEAKKHEIGDEL